jgi:hypothetical protein
MLIKLEATRIPGIKALMAERQLPSMNAAVDAAICDFLERAGLDAKEEKAEKRIEHVKEGPQPEKAAAPAINRDSADYRQGQRHAEIINAQNESLSRKLTRELPGSR